MDPYEHLRAAQAAGKRIEFNAGDGWGYLAAPNFFQPPERYRIAPGQDDPHPCPHCGKDANKPPEPVVRWGAIFDNTAIDGPYVDRDVAARETAHTLIRIACDPVTGKVIDVTTEKP